MPHRIYLLRHARAEVGAANLDDADRALVPEGLGQALQVGAALAKTRDARAPIFTSPARRCVETAAAVVTGGGLEVRPLVAPSLSLDSSRPDAVVELAGRVPPDALLVGHQPDLDRLVRQLCGPETRASLGYAGVAALEVRGAPGVWKLVWTAAPDELLARVSGGP